MNDDHLRFRFLPLRILVSIFVIQKFIFISTEPSRFLHLQKNDIDTVKNAYGYADHSLPFFFLFHYEFATFLRCRRDIVFMIQYVKYTFLPCKMSKILIAQENSIWYTELHDNMINAK